jgi:putative nucleotidyltransferase with HDIG domain
MELPKKGRLGKNEIIGRIMLKVSSFPSMPQAAVKVMALIQQKDIAIDEIAQIMRHDPGLTSNVLKLANSAYFGIPLKVGSLKQAVVLLGLKRFTQIVVAACVNDSMDNDIEGYDLPPGELWRHSIAVSSTAEALGKFKKNLATEDAFTPALLHDMGKLVLGTFVKEEFHNIEKIAAQGVPFEVAENMVLGTDHAEIGAQILTNWSFPSDIIDAVRWHHNPERIKNSKLHTEIVYLSNLMCESCSDGETTEIKPLMPSTVVLNRLGIKFAQYELISNRVYRWMNKLADSLTFD